MTKFQIKEYMDNFSVPEEVKKTKLTKIIKLKIRQAPDKPGRALTVLFDKRNVFENNFKINFSYIVDIEKGKFAGGHFHKKKREFFYPVSGEFEVYLFDIQSKNKEIIHLKRPWLLYVPNFIAHKVYSKDGGTLLVLASHHETEKDEFKIEM
jgi:oxalate decarboxylase/phosphoglucose isomerase-like protein (cupin superfamily)